MACGVPVIARRCGSVPEVIEHGVTGAVCDDDDALVDALRAVDGYDRSACRRRVEDHFSVARMADHYEAVYRRLVELWSLPTVTSRSEPRPLPLAV
jgi:glycosyltransferase involved in cell wall biosynthesis